MTPEQAAMRSKAVDALAEAFEHAHSDPRADAQRFLDRLARNGWRPVPQLVDDPAGFIRRAPDAVRAARKAEIDRILAERRAAKR
jgi:hypothetical protein